MKLTIENKYHILGRVVKHDIRMILPELVHKGETYMFKALDDNKKYYRWELTREPMDAGLFGSDRYQLIFSDGMIQQQNIIDKTMIKDIDKFLYICASMMPY